MLRIDEGRVDEAWEDLLACHRLARLVGQGSTLNEATFAVSMDLNACAGDQGFLQHARLTPAQIARMRADLDKLPPLPKLVEKINLGERFIYLDSVAMLARRGFSTLYFHADGNFTQGMLYLLMDSAAVQPSIGTTCSAWATPGTIGWPRPAASPRGPNARGAGQDRREHRASWRPRPSWKSPGPVMLAGKRYATSERLGQILMSLISPDVRWFADLNDRGAMQFDLTRLAFALAAYRADRGRYPAKLADLTPKYVAKVPKDIFNDSELHYRQEEGGYLLYSVGPNGRDDGGKGVDDRKRMDEAQGGRTSGRLGRPDRPRAGRRGTETVRILFEIYCPRVKMARFMTRAIEARSASEVSVYVPRLRVGLRSFSPASSECRAD